MKNKAGFTLIELMIAVAIISVLAASAAPSLRNYLRDRGVTDAADQLFSDLYRAKSLAIKRRANATIAFDQANNLYQITLTDPSTGAVINYPAVNLSDYSGQVQMANNPGGGNPSIGQIAFNFQGSCPVGGSGAVYLANQGNVRIYRLRTTLSGGISIHRWNRPTAAWTAR